MFEIFSLIFFRFYVRFRSVLMDPKPAMLSIDQEVKPSPFINKNPVGCIPTAAVAAEGGEGGGWRRWREQWQIQGANSKGGCEKLLFSQFFPKNCTKLKEFTTPRGPP